MKRKGNIYKSIVEKENIKFAILNAARRKMKRNNVQKVMNNIDKYVDNIQNMLINKSYTPSPYQEVKIQDGVRKKERIIFKPCFYPDQIVHWSLMLQIEEILKKGLYDYCCASIRGRGLLYGVKYIRKIIVRDRKNTKYCLKLDIKKFYPSINKEILKKKFRKVIKCGDTLDLIDLIIDSSKSGVPIGNYTSQWFANFYLQDLDHYIKEKLKVPYYIRYMDDMVLFHRNKKELHKIRIAIQDFLNKEDLKLKENWQLFKLDSRPLDFLGYRFYRGYTTLRRANFLRIKRRVKRVFKKQKINYEDASAIISYCGWLKHCNSYNYRQKYIRPYISIKKCKEVVSNESRK
jgi:RNA-directed DNA polymerase|nr:MAG TPA: hypothetical protein [Caudoviricetes sp.]